MALTERLSNEAVNAELAGPGLTPLLDGGFLDLYSGVQPATADSDVGAAVLLASLQFGTPAFGTPVAGTANANAITPEDDALANGIATWYRCYKADHVSPVQDGSVGTIDCNLNLTDTNIVLHSVVEVGTFVLTASKS